MRFYFFVLFCIFLQYNNFASAQQKPIRFYEKIANNLYKKSVDINLIYWGVNFNDYKFNDIFDEALNYGIIDSISKIISVKKQKIIDQYNNWDIQEASLLSKQISFNDKRTSDSILRANGIKDEDQLINRWGEDSLIVLNRTIEFFGLLYLPDCYILTALRTYCQGICSSEFIVVFRYYENKKLKLIFKKGLSIM